MRAILSFIICGYACADVAAQTASPQADFARDVVGALSRAGCNTGNCHGSPLKKQNGGFRLSLFGSRPIADYIAIADGPGERLIDERNVEKSRLLRVATGELAHSAPNSLSRKSLEFRVLKNWIAEGAPPPTKEYFRDRLRVVPSHTTSRPGESLKVRVLAIDSQKRERDVTAWCRIRVEHPGGYQWKQEAKGRFRVAENGRFKIVAHYGGRSAVAAVDVPYANAAAEFKWSADDQVDRFLSARWKHMGLQPAADADDATIVRRLYLHLIGRRPTYAELTAFVKSNRSGKRRRLIDALMSHPEYARHWALEWQNWLAVPQKRLAATEQQALTNWLRKMLDDNVSALDISKRLITATGEPDKNGAVAFRLACKSEQERAEAAAKVFLGVNIRCFRCHDHPRSKWRVNDYHALVACFAGESVRGPRGRRRLLFRRARYRHPETAAVMTPAVFGEAMTAKSADTRVAFADWMARDKKQRFARNIVNRYWKALFGEGLVKDGDDSFPDNPSPHTKLLSVLTRDFVQHDYNVKYLLRRLCSVRAYRIGWKSPNDKAMSWRGEYARRSPQRLAPHILIREVQHATGVDLKQAGVPLEEVSMWGGWWKNRPATSFEPGVCDRRANDTLPQSLNIINGPGLSPLVAHPKGRAARLSASKKTDSAVIDELFGVTYIRPPTAEERAKCLDHIKKIRQLKKGNRREAVEDILWALLNSKEFLFNI